MSRKVWNLPNKLTLARVCVIPVFVALFMLDGVLPHARLLAELAFVLASATDWADGFIARKYNMITNLGKFMDPLADKLLVCAALVMLSGAGEIPAWVAVIVLSREFIVTGFRTVAASNGVVIAAGFLGKFKTVTQMALLIIMIPNIGAYVYMPWSGGVVFALMALCVLLTVASGAEYIARNIKVLGEGQ